MNLLCSSFPGREGREVTFIVRHGLQMRFIDWLFLYLRYSRPLRSRLFFSLHMLFLLLVSRMDIIITRQDKKDVRSDLLPPTPPLIVQGHHGRFVGRPSFYSPPPSPYLFFSSTPGRMGRRFSEIASGRLCFGAFKFAMANFVLRPGRVTQS